MQEMERHAILHVFFTLKYIHMKTPLKKIKVDIRTLSTLIFFVNREYWIDIGSITCNYSQKPAF